MAKKNNYLGGIIGTGVTNLVGVGLIGATAGEVNALPAGTAKSIAGIVPGLQATSLVGANLGAFGNSSSPRRRSSKRR